MESEKILIAGFVIEVRGENFCRFIRTSGAFAKFGAEGEAELKVIEDLPVTDGEDADDQALYEIEFEGVECAFVGDGHGLRFTMCDGATGERLVLRWHHGEGTVHATGSLCRDLVTRFGLWMAVNALVLPHGCAAVHSSVNVCDGAALLCLGESGTGKSTHTRLLREVYPEIFLLNDDSPFVRVAQDGKIMVYGSPWSGKTPCYKQLAFPLRAVMRLSQAPYNKIHRLSPLMAIGALQPSMPPAFNYAEETCDAVCSLVSDIVSAAAFWHLECLPDHDAARLSHDTIFG